MAAEQSNTGGCRLAIFDFDGTLADSAGWMIEVFNPMADRFGFRSVTAAEIAMLRGKSSREIIRYLKVPWWRLPAIARYAREMSARDAHRIPMFEGAAGLLRRLSDAGIKLAIVSSNGEATVRQVLGDDLSGRIGYFACGTSMFGKAAKLKAAARAAGAPRDAASSIGDETRDIEAARKAGVRSVAVTWGYATEAALVAAKPDALVRDFAALAQLLAP